MKTLFSKLRSFIKTQVDYVKELVPYWQRVMQDLHITAAALTYYTIIGIVPLWMCIYILCDVSNTNVSVSSSTDLLMPNIGDSVGSFDEIAQIGIKGIFTQYKWFGWIALAVIIYAVICFFNNVQHAFNKIWGSKNRTLGQSLSLYFKMIIVIAITSTLFTEIIGHLSSPVLQYSLLFIILFLFIALAFRSIPYDKKPKWGPTFLSSAGTSICLLAWSLVLPYLVSNLMRLKFDGINILLIVFWLFWAWQIILIGAVGCHRLNKTGFYLDRKIDYLAPSYRRYLTLLTIAHIFRLFDQDEHLKGLSFEQIAKDMFPLGDGSTSSSSGRKQTYVSIPATLLDSILKELCKSGILVTEDSDKVRYFPKHQMLSGNRTLHDYTIGDVLFILDTLGNFKLDDLTPQICSSFKGSYIDKHLNLYSDKVFATPIMLLTPQNFPMSEENSALLDKRATYSSQLERNLI